jgi:hypothetical protein
MAQTVNFQYTPTKTDYVHGMRAYLIRSWRIWIAYAVFGLMFAIGICSLVVFEGTYVSWLWILLSVLFFAFQMVLAPMLLGRRVRRNERLRAEMFWQVNDEHILVKNKFAETKFDWGTFHKVLETKRYYLFIYSVNKRMFQIVPKRAFESSEQETAFRDLLKRNIAGFG